MRRRLYLMRHGAVSYFDAEGRPLPPDAVPLNDEGRRQAHAAAAALEAVDLDRVIASGLPRTVETARIVAPGHEVERRPELNEIRGGTLGSIPEEELEDAFVHAFRGVVPDESRFLGGDRSASSGIACSPRSTGCWPTTTGTRRWPSSTAASTGRFSPGR